MHPTSKAVLPFSIMNNTALIMLLPTSGVSLLHKGRLYSMVSGKIGIFQKLNVTTFNKSNTFIAFYFPEGVAQTKKPSLQSIGPSESPSQFHLDNKQYINKYDEKNICEQELDLVITRDRLSDFTLQ